MKALIEKAQGLVGRRVTSKNLQGIVKEWGVYMDGENKNTSISVKQHAKEKGFCVYVSLDYMSTPVEYVREETAEECVPKGFTFIGKMNSDKYNEGDEWLYWDDHDDNWEQHSEEDRPLFGDNIYAVKSDSITAKNYNVGNYNKDGLQIPDGGWDAYEDLGDNAFYDNNCLVSARGGKWVTAPGTSRNTQQSLYVIRKKETERQKYEREKVSVEMSKADLALITAVLGQSCGEGSWDLFNKLDDLCEELDLSHFRHSEVYHKISIKNSTLEIN